MHDLGCAPRGCARGCVRVSDASAGAQPKKEIHVTLNLDHPLGVLRTSLQAAIDSASLCMNALARPRATQPAQPETGEGETSSSASEREHLAGAKFVFDFAPPSPDPEGTARMWIARSAIHDLVKALQLPLEEAFLIAQFIDRVAHPEKGMSEEWLAAVQSKSTPAAKSFHGDGFDKKLPALKKKLGVAPSGAFEERWAEVESIIRARNCLEHRDGIVGDKDIKAPSDALVVHWRAPRLLDLQGNEIPPNTSVDGFEWRPAMLREYTFKRGERVEFSIKDFTEMCIVVNRFGEQLREWVHAAATAAGVPQGDAPPKYLGQIPKAAAE